MRIVKVTWRDVIASNEWEKAGAISCPKILSVGWLVSEDSETIKIANTLDLDDFEGKAEEKPVPYGITAFPRGCVVSVEDV